MSHSLSRWPLRISKMRASIAANVTADLRSIGGVPTLSRVFPSGWLSACEVS